MLFWECNVYSYFSYTDRFVDIFFSCCSLLNYKSFIRNQEDKTELQKTVFLFQERVVGASLLLPTPSVYGLVLIETQSLLVTYSQL